MRWLVAVVVVAGCGLVGDPDVGALQPGSDEPAPDAGATASGPCGDSNPTLGVSFARDLRPLTTRSPGGCGCHAASATAGFNLGSYDSLRRGGTTSGTRIIVPGKPCDSVLVQKLGFAPPFGARMPYNGPPFFTAAELTLLRDWIAEGALDN